MTMDRLVGEAPAAPGASLQGAGVVFTTTLGQFVSVTPTIVAVLGVYLKPISEEFGWSRSAVAPPRGSDQ